MLSDIAWYYETVQVMSVVGYIAVFCAALSALLVVAIGVRSALCWIDDADEIGMNPVHDAVDRAYCAISGDRQSGAGAEWAVSFGVPFMLWVAGAAVVTFLPFAIVAASLYGAAHLARWLRRMHKFARNHRHDDSGRPVA